MKRFLAIYIGSVPPPEKAERQLAQHQARDQRGMQAWGEWVTTHWASLVDLGSPVGKTKRASREGVVDVVNRITAYTIVQAESHDAAARMFENHPHFSIFPGDSVEIIECLPMPKA